MSSPDEGPLEQGKRHPGLEPAGLRTTMRDKSTECLEIKVSDDNLTSAKAEIPLSPPCLHKPLGRKA